MLERRKREASFYIICYAMCCVVRMYLCECMIANRSINWRHSTTLEIQFIYIIFEMLFGCIYRWIWPIINCSRSNLASFFKFYFHIFVSFRIKLPNFDNINFIKFTTSLTYRFRFMRLSLFHIYLYLYVRAYRIMNGRKVLSIETPAWRAVSNVKFGRS